jgi:SAM-dependent methyltransferase
LTGWLEDPEAVADQYEVDDDLRQRVLAHQELLAGPNDEEIVRSRVLGVQPRRLLEVGSGLGAFCTWAKAHLEAEIVAVDFSERMVELAIGLGVDALQADVRRLPFRDADFDCVVANFVLYHVTEIDLAISELARVLEGEGVLVASTASDDTESRRLAWAVLFDEGPIAAPPPLSFSRENGRRLLLRKFESVEQIDCDAALVFESRDRLIAYIESLPPMKGLGPKVPELTEPFRLPTKTTVFAARNPK